MFYIYAGILFLFYIYIEKVFIISSTLYVYNLKHINSVLC
jgi:hypothetical protein